MKKIQLTIEDLFNVQTSEIFNPDEYKPVSSVSIDSRNIAKNSIFIAIKGKTFDGHDFIQDAINNGAACVVINKKRLKDFSDLQIPFVTVKNTTLALGDIARIWRNKLRTKIIAITGSAGKTSTKEMIALMLSEKYSVYKTVGNNNNHIGVPLTLLSTNNEHDILVAELGTNHFGEIEYTSSISQPDYALITNIGSSHLEFLKNKSGVLKEKIALFKAAAERNGLLFINNDDPLLKRSAKNYPNKITYGFNKESDVRGTILGYTAEGNSIVEINYKSGNSLIKINETVPLLGEQNARNFLAASAVGFSFGLTEEEFSSSIKKLKAVDKRMNVKNFGSFTLIDDTYNANPDSMKYAIEFLNRIKTHKIKIALLGDMFELGNEAVKIHKRLAQLIKKNKIDFVYTIGSLMKVLNTELQISKKDCKHFNSRTSLNKFLLEKDFNDSVILIKGSRGMKMEEFVKTIESKMENV